MNILALDTSTDILAVALKTSEGWADAGLDLGLRHAERLMDLVSFCMAKAGLEAKDLDLLACAAGPGSFTGLRIGMATAKGMALALGKPFIALPTMDAFAWGLEAFPGAVVPIVDAKKGRLYAAIYQRGRPMSASLDISLAGLLALVDTYPEVLFTGPDADMLEPTASERSGMHIDRRRLPAARALAALAEEAFSKGQSSDPGEGPVYLRPSEAEEARPNRTGDLR